MKRYLILTIVILIGIIAILYNSILNTSNKWKIAEANVKAYSEELSTANKKSIALLLSIDLLEYFNDSILESLNSTREALNIKDKNLKALQYIKSKFSKTDTIVFTLVDTLFKDSMLAIDTVINDGWYKLDLNLKYPSTIIVNPEFISEKHIIVSTKKETVKPPKKFFLARWFLKKHIVLNVNVEEKNPYVNSLNSKYVEILK